MVTKNKMFENVNTFVDDFLKSNLSGRYQEVIRCRYGIDGANPETLQAIGNRYGITRERVRQIEALALENLLKVAKNYPNLIKLMDTATSRLKSVGGIEEEGSLLNYLKTSLNHGEIDARFANSIKFVLELSGKINRHSDNYDKDWRCYWYLGKEEESKAKGFITKLVSSLNSKKNAIVSGNNFNEVFAQVTKQSNLKEETAKNLLAISKKFVTGPFGHFGLADWSEINPKTARDWAYAILKKEQKPLHFSELYKMISGHRSDKKTNLQTVHNELIKDERFVLVGRGLYGLKEHGLIPGTAKEIIAHFLKKHGPMTHKEISELVLGQRMIKPTTIMINLQNKKHFVSTPDGKYDVKEA